MSLHRMLRAAAGRNSTPVANTDPQFNYVSMLLHGDGTNGAQNNTFIDSSTNNFTITRNGNTTQGSLSPYGNLWSNYFDGNGDYLSSATSTSLDFGTGDFTVEAWVNLDSTVNPNRPDSLKTVTVFSTGSSGSNDSSFAIYGSTSSPGVGMEFYQVSPSVAFAVAAPVSLNSWVHVAWVRSGTTFYAFVNGVRYTLGTSSSAVGTGGTTPKIAIANTSGFTNQFKGGISNLRVIKGTALYTSNFTPPTAPLTAISGTSLLTCQSNRFIDNSANNFTITRNGDVRVIKDSPFLPTAAYSTSTIGGSGYFDGAGDWLRIDNNTAFDLSTGSWTIEAWIYVTGGTYYRTIISKRATSPSANCDFEFGVSNTNTLYFYRSGAGAFNGSATVPTNTWVHAAITYDGTTFRMFQNGVLVFSQAGLTATYNTYPIGIGNWDGPGNQDFFGYISNLRVVKGTAAYTAAFTPPTAPVTAISGTSLLLNFTNAGIFDNAAENDLETVGNAQISTSVKKYGTGSIAFDGSGDRILVPGNQNLRLGSGNFTIEMWLYVNSTSDMQIINTGDSANYSYAIYKAGTNLGFYLSSNGTSWNLASGNTFGTVNTGTWYHVALVRNGSTVTPYLNGVAGTSATVTAALADFAVLGIGDSTQSTPGASTLNGYIDDLRITKGYARYTANFTPPTAAFPDQ